MPVDNPSAGTVVQTAFLATGIFGLFMPPISELMDSEATNDNATRKLRLGEYASAAMTIGISAYVAYVAGDSRPVIAATGLVLALIMLYEHLLRSNPTWTLGDDNA